MGISAGHQTMLKTRVKYPWDYRVEYFQVASLYPRFEVGPLNRYNENWTSELILDANSTLQIGIHNNINGWVVFSFPNAVSQDQKNCGNVSTFCVYPYSNRYNFGYTTWVTQPTAAQVASITSTNTITRGFIENDGTNTVKYGVAQGTNSWQYNGYSTTGKRFRADLPFPIMMYAEGSSYQQSNVSIGTRFYECGFDFNIPSNLEMHVRFVPCVLNDTPYICEMYSKTMIPNSLNGTVTVGPKVKDDYEAWPT